MLTPDRAGAYHLSLVVNDGHVDSAASPVVVNVNLNLPPVASATGTPVTGSVPLPVQFSAAASHDPEGSLLTYSWDFGDPASGASNVGSGVSALHTYGVSGSYIAVVTVTDNAGNTGQASVTVTATAPNVPPVVLPTALPNSGASPLRVHFAANATDANASDVLAYRWDFGDPGSGAQNASTQANPEHVYSYTGTYTAVVVVSDGVTPGVSARLTISVNSALTIEVTEARVQRGERGRVDGKVSLKADFVNYAGVPLDSDAIRVTFDGVTLLDVPFGRFRRERRDRYEYETRSVDAEIDFERMTIKVSRHDMLTTGIDNSNGIDVEISFGDAVATDHIVMTRERDRHDSDLSHKR